MNSTDIARIEYCQEFDEDCNIYFSAVYTAANLMSAFINILHLHILSKMTNLTGSNYYYILVNLTINDIFVSCCFAIGGICGVQKFLALPEKHLAGILLLIARDVFVNSRYYQLTLASLDRFYAICKPFDYAESRVLQNIGKLFVLGWIFNIILSITLNFTYREDICVAQIIGVRLRATSSTSKLYALPLTILPSAIPSVITSVLIIKVVKELNAMKQRTPRESEDLELKSATKYIVIVCVMFYCSLTPLLLLMLSRALFGINTYQKMSTIKWFVFLCQTLYGIGNVIVYGFVNRGYVRKAKELFCFCIRIRKVEPE